MGSWSVSCGISNIAITSGNECCILPLKGDMLEEEGGFTPTMLPIFGKYNDYGGMKDIIEDENTKLIEEHLGITIVEFIEFLVDGKFTYNRDEAKATQVKLEDNGKYTEVENMRFMWIDKQVYDFMIVSHDKWEKGNHSFGTPEMLKFLGFTFIEEISKDNKKYQRDELVVFSNGISLKLENGQSIFYTDKGCDYSLTTYMELPKEIEYIKDKTKTEMWEILPTRKAKSMLNWIFGSRHEYEYDYGFEDTILELLRERAIELGNEIPTEIPKRKIEVMYKHYFENLELFGDKIVELINIKCNFHPMSGRFQPHILYLTPQCGEHSTHQLLLEEFARINKSYIDEDE